MMVASFFFGFLWGVFRVPVLSSGTKRLSSQRFFSRLSMLGLREELLGRRDALVLQVAKGLLYAEAVDALRTGYGYDAIHELAFVLLFHLFVEGSKFVLEGLCAILEVLGLFFSIVHVFGRFCARLISRRRTHGIRSYNTIQCRDWELVWE